MCTMRRFIFSLLFLTLCVILGNRNLVECGNVRPYGVSVAGFQGAGTTGHDISAGGYAGSAVIAPLATSGFNSPLGTYTPGNVFPSASGGYGFGGFGVGSTQGLSGDQSLPVAGGQGKLPSAAYAG